MAAIDLGTTSCRLLVAHPDRASFRVVDSFSSVVRLGEGVQASNRLIPEAIDRTFEALKVCQQKIHKNKATRIRAVTTEACRRAENSEDLLGRARLELGLNIEVISPAEEARLALTGCAAILDPKIPYAVAFDIGGGSTEIMWLKVIEESIAPHLKIPMIEVIDSVSLPFGVVTLSEIYGIHLTDKKQYQDLRTKVAYEVLKFTHQNHIYAHIQAGSVQMTGTSGTVTTIAAIHLELPKYDRRFVDGLLLNISDIHRVSEGLLKLTHQERIRKACIGLGRADFVMMGAAILEGICDVWSLPCLTVADRGVREGIMIDLLKTLPPKRFRS
jgi:exopolyphosphatase/guanosine-5'-triphosphate,3'-diphosphate pyrophosphatase